MRRAALVVILALLTFDVTGLSSALDEAGCDQSCPGDSPAGQCPPNCHSCSCCSLPQVTPPAITTLVAPTARHNHWFGSSDEATPPEPADILHVPKRLA